METAALVSSILSIILSIIIGGFAIWLSVTFYRMSNKISEDTKEAAKGISASVNRLESLFDSLYSDTFSMMKDTVTDMRKHIWPVKEKSAEEQKQIEEKADAKIDKLKKQISDEVSGVIARVGKTDSKIDDVENKLEKLVEGAIQKTRQVESEAQEEKFLSQITLKILSYVQYYRDHMFNLNVAMIVKAFKSYYAEETIYAAIQYLLDRKELYAAGSLSNPGTVIGYNE